MLIQALAFLLLATVATLFPAARLLMVLFLMAFVISLLFGRRLTPY